MEAVFAFIIKNVRYPDLEQENGVQGKVHVTFMVDKEGTLRDACVVVCPADQVLFKKRYAW